MLDVLIVEDDDASREALDAWLRAQGLDCRPCEDIAAGRAAVAERLPDLAILDLELPDGSGLELLSELSELADTEVVMASGRTTVDAAIDALRLGARDFLTKPLDMDRLGLIVRNLARTAELRREVNALRGELRRMGRFGSLVGSSPAMQKVYEQIERVAPTSETVFVTGSTGTGKEVTAATLHQLSRRSKQPLVALNCGAVPANLIESELFGHERGAFTGADKRHKGVFERASGGTLLLDELAEMPLEAQVKLLRVLETSRLTRVGGSEEIEVDVRVIAATNRDPHEAVADGCMREDLLYRLYVFPIELPDLAERGDDVIMLAQVFLDQLNEKNDTAKVLSRAAKAKLRAHDWPGNIRELLNAIRRAHIMAREDEIGPGELPFDVDASALRDDDAGEDEGRASVKPVDVPAGSIVIEPGLSIAEVEQRLIEATLEQLDGDKKSAAKQLGISLKTLYARLKVYAAARDGGA